MTGGVPTLTPDEASAVASRRLSGRDVHYLRAAGDDDLALLNACLSVEEGIRQEQFATLERLLSHCQFADGALSDRIYALPNRAFARAANDLYHLGWVDANEKEW